MAGFPTGVKNMGGGALQNLMGGGGVLSQYMGGAWGGLPRKGKISCYYH